MNPKEVYDYEEIYEYQFNGQNPWKVGDIVKFRGSNTIGKVKKVLTRSCKVVFINGKEAMIEHWNLEIPSPTQIAKARAKYECS